MLQKIYCTDASKPPTSQSVVCRRTNILTDFGFAGYNDMQALMTQVGNHVVIDFGGGDTLQLNNMTIATLNTHAADFLL